MKDKREITYEDLLLYAHGSAAFQVLYAATQLKIFESLYRKPHTTAEISSYTKLPIESVRALLFSLIALKLIKNNRGYYTNNRLINKIISKNEHTMLTNYLSLQYHIIYPGQTHLLESLTKGTNEGLKQFPGEGSTIYQRLVQYPQLQEVFYRFMESFSSYAIKHLLNQVDFTRDSRILDIGSGAGGNAIAIAKLYPKVKIIMTDLPEVRGLARKNIRKHNFQKRIKFQSRDMFKDQFPKNQDSVLFIHQLVIWSKEENINLLRKAFQCLKKKGRVIIFNSIADDSETGPIMAALHTMYFKTISTGRGMIYPWKDYNIWLKNVGFSNIKKIRCNTWTPHGIIIAYKP